MIRLLVAALALVGLVSGAFVCAHGQGDLLTFAGTGGGGFVLGILVRDHVFRERGD